MSQKEDAEALMRELCSTLQSAGDLGYAQLRIFLWQAQVLAAAHALMPSDVAELRTVSGAQDLTPEAADRVQRWLALGVVAIDDPMFRGLPPTWRLTALGNAAIELRQSISDIIRSQT